MVAVISGDLIKSSQLSPRVREKLFINVEAFLIQLGKKDKLFKAETNKGDWFQCLLKNPAQALRYTLIIKTYLRSLHIGEKSTKSGSVLHGFDARFAIGIGGVDFENSRLGSSDGPAFQISGRLLEKMKKTNRTIEGQAEGFENVNEELATLFNLLDFIFTKTTNLQCEVIYRKLLGKKEIEIAKDLNILQSAVNQRSTAAGWNAIETALNRFEKVISEING